MRVHLHHPDALAEILQAERRRYAVAPVAQPDAAGGPIVIPYLMAANKNESTPFATIVQVLDANSHEFEVNIPPGGFLRGVEVKVSSANGVLGTATLLPDAPWSLISSFTLEDIGGEGVLKPMTMLAHMLKQKWFEPWRGDPSLRAGYSRSVNPAFTLRTMVEVRDTLAVLANGDARAQYRVKFTIAPIASYFGNAVGLTTAPTVTVKISPLKWANTDAVDVLENPIDPRPLGIDASRFFQHQMINDFGSTDNTPRLELTGQEIRALGFIVRDSTGARVDLTDAGAGTITLSMDDRVYWKRTASQWIEEMCDFYTALGNGTWTRDVGVFIVPRFRQPGTLLGEFWLQTVEQNNMVLELSGGDLGANAPGSIEVLYDNMAVEAGVVLDPSLEGI